MAGTLQTLILTPPSPQTQSFRLRSPRFPPSHTFFYSTSINFNHNRSIYRPITALERSDQRDGNGDKVNQVSGSASGLNWAKPLLNFVANNFLPVALVSGVALGLANPSLGCLADRYSLSKFSTFGIFIISGLTLRSRDIGAATEAWPVGVFGLVSILMISPYFSRAILQMQMKPQEFVTGLAIFSCMPTTLSSGVALTQLAGGNSALALAMTVISNILGILIVPFSISKFIADGVGVSVPTKQLFRSLVLTLLVPLILGKVFRESFKGLADFVDQKRTLFSKFSALFLSLGFCSDIQPFSAMLRFIGFFVGICLMVPWIQVSRSRSLLLMVKPTVFLIAIGMGALLHVFLLAFNALAIQSLSAVTGGSKSNFSKKENATALVLVASQKTLPVMVAVVEQLGGAFGESGLLVLPCVAAHINQIIMDSVIVNLWLRKDPVSYNAKVN